MIEQAPCQSCGTTNRIAPGRPAAAAQCGKCGARLFAGTVAEVDDTGWARLIAGVKGHVVLDVWAPWCGPCRAMAPEFAKAAEALQGQVLFAKINADSAQAPAALRVSAIPTLILFKDGKEIARRSGAVSAAELTLWLRNAAHPHHATGTRP